MKGIVFTELLNMIETAHGYELVDDIINTVNPKGGGAYTAIGTYDHEELVDLVVAYSEKSGQEIPEVLRLFGHHLFQVFLTNYPDFFRPDFDSFAFLKSIDNYIHIEVAKLYPDAQLPRFNTSMNDESTMEMIYLSERKMAPLAQGLIEKTLEHYQEEGEIRMENLKDDGTKVKFTIIKR